MKLNCGSQITNKMKIKDYYAVFRSFKLEHEAALLGYVVVYFRRLVLDTIDRSLTKTNDYRLLYDSKIEHYHIQKFNNVLPKTNSQK